MASNDSNAIVAMSGGVDSAVAAALLKRRGYEMTGVYMCLGQAAPGIDSRGCCSPADAADARRAAEKLGIRLYVLDLGHVFRPIIADFLDEYARGRTPNPCIHCNRRIKFGRLLLRAESLGVRYVATGHHARRIETPDGPRIARGLAEGKDQSYSLFSIPRASLERILLPIGEIGDKAEVRNLARSLELNVHDKPDSQEVCFVPDDDYVALLRLERPEAMRPGPIVNADGDVLGEHDGYGQFTIGQRRGLRVAAGVPMYVTHIDPETARVTIGTREQAASRHLSAAGANWHADAPDEFDATVQIRYNHRGSPGRVTVTGPETFDVRFEQPVHAVTPGQAAVVYDGDVLLGGGWIE